MSAYETFRHECAEEIAAQGQDAELRRKTHAWFNHANARKYSYHFEWQGRPVVQYPQDLLAMQEIIWTIKPDLIIETGIARGGSLIFSASMLELNAVCGGPQSARVVGIDVDIRAHNRLAIENHPLSRRITMIEGSSIAQQVIEQVRAAARGKQSVLVVLDSNHTHDHVIAELYAYADLVTPGSYCVVFDTVIEDMPSDAFPDRPWLPGNNPKTAVWEYVKSHPEFQIDADIHNNLLITVAPDGYLKRIS